MGNNIFVHGVNRIQRRIMYREIWTDGQPIKTNPRAGNLAFTSRVLAVLKVGWHSSDRHLLGVSLF
jgi:hypothetical protein